jgi:ribonuclease J
VTDSPRIRLTPLGGVSKFGRNCLLVEHLDGSVDGGAAIVIDCGVRFLGGDMPGYDASLPDMQALARCKDRVLGYVYTHGHEDHIGAAGHAQTFCKAPIYATGFTARLIKHRLDERGVAGADIHVVKPGDTNTLGPFRFTHTAVSHSIPDATALVVHTPAGTIVHSGDFRVDDNPLLGPPTDMDSLTRAGDDGVVCLLADSTGALSVGHNPGERSVFPAMHAAVSATQGRVVVALFASHIQRLALLADVCRQTGRKLCVLGRGLHRCIDAARAENLFAGSAIDDVLVDEHAIKNLAPHRQCFAVTGTQGEDNAMLSRLSRDDAPVSVSRGDRVILSSRVIPGNELALARVLDRFAERDIDVVAGRSAPHVSGHGHHDDMTELLLATRPRLFVALHGDATHLRNHRQLATDAGMKATDVIGVTDGHSLTIDRSDGSVQTSMTPHVLQEPVVVGGIVDHDPMPTVFIRRRMGTGGVCVVQVDEHGTPHLTMHGTGPALSSTLQRAVHDAAHELAFLYEEKERRPVFARLARAFRKADRPVVELVFVPSRGR